MDVLRSIRKLENPERWSWNSVYHAAEGNPAFGNNIDKNKGGIPMFRTNNNYNFDVRNGKNYIVYENSNRNALGKLFGSYHAAHDYAVMRINQSAKFCVIWNVDTDEDRFVETVRKYNHRT